MLYSVHYASNQLNLYVFIGTSLSRFSYDFISFCRFGSIRFIVVDEFINDYRHSAPFSSSIQFQLVRIGRSAKTADALWPNQFDWEMSVGIWPFEIVQFNNFIHSFETFHIDFPVSPSTHKTQKMVKYSSEYNSIRWSIGLCHYKTIELCTYRETDKRFSTGQHQTICIQYIMK